jgi:hypothetical protein
MAPKQERKDVYGLPQVSGVTNAWQHQGSKPPHLLELRDTQTLFI